MPSTVTSRLEGLETSVAVKAPCRVATTANITLSGLQTIDGVALAARERVLVKDQTSEVDNGIWVAGSGAWTRALDFDGTRDAVGGTLVYVIEGAANANTYWRVDGTGAMDVGTDSVGFTPAVALTYIADATGAVARPTLDRLRDVVSVRDFGVLGVNTPEDVARFQTAIDSGKSLRFPEGNYWLNNLTGDQDGQEFYGNGNVHFYKNGNGLMLEHDGDDFAMHGILCDGTGYTGDNLVLNGLRPRLWDCGSQNTPGRAVKAPNAGHLLIMGTRGSYHTTNADHFAIEAGTSGVASLYINLNNVLSTGVKFTDVGGCAIVGGEIDYITVAAGTSPVGVSGGQFVGVRIPHDVSLGLSNSNFAGCPVGGSITLESGTTGACIDGSNNVVGGIINNSGNVNHFLVQNAYSAGQMRWRIGASSSLAEFGVDVATGTWNFAGTVTVPNTKNVGVLKADGSIGSYLGCDASGNGSVTLGGAATFGIVGAGSGGLYVNISGTSIHQTYSGGLRPATNSAYNLGTSSQRWAGTYSDAYFVGAATKISSGAGSPNGAVVGSPGDLYLNTSGGAGTTLYVKESGAATNTGWVGK